MKENNSHFIVFSFNMHIFKYLFTPREKEEEVTQLTKRKYISSDIHRFSHHYIHAHRWEWSLTKV